MGHHSPSHHTSTDAASRKRSRSPYRADGQLAKRHRTHHASTAPPPTSLPCSRAPLDRKRELKAYEGLFAEYLDVVKGLRYAELSKEEARGRWKSFVRRWNEGTLSVGWYDLEYGERARERWETGEGMSGERLGWKEEKRVARSGAKLDNAMPDGGGDEEEEDDGYGPSMPPPTTRQIGPAIPGLDDLHRRDELSADDWKHARDDLRHTRKEDSALQTTRLEDLAPRADPGSRARQLEKKAEVSATNRAFREAKSPGAEDVGERDVMGGDDGVKAQIQAQQSVRNARQARKEEVLRARAAEREERVKGARVKEERVLEGLREIARRRFGAA